MNTTKIETIERVGYGLTMILAPIVLALGFAIHPKDGQTGAAALQVIADHKGLWELAHILLIFAAALLIPASIGIGRRIAAGRPWIALIGTAATVFGAVFFASLIAAEGISGSALASVSAQQQPGVAAGMQAILDSKGALPIVNLAFFMLLGFLLLGVGLLLESSLPRWVGICVIAGAIVLAPMISEQVEAVGALIMLIGFGYVGIESVRNTTPKPVVEHSDDHGVATAQA